MRYANFEPSYFLKYTYKFIEMRIKLFLHVFNDILPNNSN